MEQNINPDRYSSDAFNTFPSIKAPVQLNPLTDGERREVTIIFMDLVDFTPMAEQQADLESVHKILTIIFAEFSTIIRNNKGLLESYIGDAIMAVWGIQKSDERDACNAVKAAVECRNALPRINTLLESHNVAVKIRIGINAGDVVLKIRSSADSDRAANQDWSIIGDTVNTASRLQSIAPVNEIYISASVLELTRNEFECVDSGFIKVKGKEQSIHVYSVIGFGSADTVRWNRSILLKNSKLVGRENELELLDTIMNLPVEKNITGYYKPQVIFVQAEAGYGKSRLCHEFIKSHKLSVIQTFAHPYLETPNALWKRLLRGIFTNKLKNSTDLSSLIKMLSEISEKNPDNNNPVIDDILLKLKNISDDITQLPDNDSSFNSYDEDDYKFKQGIRWIVEGLTEIGYSTLYIDDYHWIDYSSDHVLAYLINTIRTTQPFYVLISSRTGKDVPNFPELNARTHVIKLSKLNQNLSKLLIHHLFIGFIPSSAERYIIEYADGSPYYLEELSLTLIQKNILISLGDRWKLNKNIDEVELPHTLKSITISQIDTIPIEYRAILQVAAVLGLEFTALILLKVCDATTESHQVHDAINYLLQQGYILKIENEPGTYGFVHALLQKSVYDSILKSNRQIIHKAAAQIYEAMLHDKNTYLLPKIAYHWFYSREKEAATKWLEKVIQECEANFRFVDGINWVEKFESLCETGDLSCSDPSLAIWLLYTKTNFLLSLGRLTGVTENLHKMIEFAVSNGLNDQIGKADELFGTYYYMTGNLSDSLEFYNRALSYYTSLNDIQKMAQLHNKIGAHKLKTGNVIDAQQSFLTAIELAYQINQHDLIAQLKANYGLTCIALKDMPQAVIHFNSAMELYTSTQNLKGQAFILSNLGRVYVEEKNFDEAEKCYTRALAIQRDLVNFMREAMLLINIGDLKLAMKDTDGAIENYKLAEIIAKGTSLPRLIAEINFKYGLLYFNKQDLAKAELYLQTALNHLKSSGNIITQADVLTYLGLLYYEKKMYENAKYCVNQIAELLKNTNINLENSSEYIKLRTLLSEI